MPSILKHIRDIRAVQVVSDVKYQIDYASPIRDGKVLNTYLRNESK